MIYIHQDRKIDIEEAMNEFILSVNAYEYLENHNGSTIITICVMYVLNNIILVVLAYNVWRFIL